ncbi:MAG: isopentenyl-diphosphate Delta-isomerase [Gammaproteobacteria bacterium]|nr:isopentenyl-diphosphate Delta-isomerase [Gammaproteobacteria bacterium]
MSGLARAPVTEDLLILVDEADREIGTLPKTECHLGGGTLHRAFSVFLFAPDGKVLIQERTAGKMLWPGFWSNSCCSHPRPGEDTGAAAQRRVREELHVECRLDFLYKFRYQAAFGSVGSEHELCHVYAGYATGDISTDPLEIAAIRWLTPAALSREIAAEPERFSPWMKLEWQQITANYLDRILDDCRKQQTWRT